MPFLSDCCDPRDEQVLLISSRVRQDEQRSDDAPASRAAVTTRQDGRVTDGGVSQVEGGM
jgi:hypothetical protein